MLWFERAWVGPSRSRHQVRLPLRNVKQGIGGPICQPARPTSSGWCAGAISFLCFFLPFYLFLFFVFLCFLSQFLLAVFSLFSLLFFFSLFLSQFSLAYIFSFSVLFVPSFVCFFSRFLLVFFWFILQVSLLFQTHFWYISNAFLNTRFTFTEYMFNIFYIHFRQWLLKTFIEYMFEPAGASVPAATLRVACKGVCRMAFLALRTNVLPSVFLLFLFLCFPYLLFIYQSINQSINHHQLY